MVVPCPGKLLFQTYQTEIDRRLASCPRLCQLFGYSYPRVKQHATWFACLSLAHLYVSQLRSLEFTEVNLSSLHGCTFIKRMSTSGAGRNRHPTTSALRGLCPIRDWNWSVLEIRSELVVRVTGGELASSTSWWYLVKNKEEKVKLYLTVVYPH